MNKPSYSRSSAKKHTLFISIGFFIALSLTFVLNVFAINIPPNVGSLDVRNITPQTVAAMFKPPLAFLTQKELAIKVLIPKFIFAYSPDGLLYAIPHSDRPDSYWIEVTDVPDCNGATSCSNIILQAKKLGSPEILTLEQQLALGEESYARLTPDKRDPNPPTVVTLDNGIKAVYHPWLLLWKYTSSYLSWDDNGVRYQAIEKKGDKATMLKMVNSIYKK
jgi:hypothetical protein